ncbi:MAG: hypothetical protein KA923_04465 [Opitutaceae bacterium]|jgi:hypothetical protein|nr:hypothetical protein [Opitutaceae bacterium]
MRFSIGALIGCAVCCAEPNSATQAPQSFESIAKKQFGPGSLTEEIIAGCTKYREATGRWAKSEEDVAAGLRMLGRSPTQFATIKSFSVEDKGSEAVYTYTDQSGVTIVMPIRIQESKQPNLESCVQPGA